MSFLKNIFNERKGEDVPSVTIFGKTIKFNEETTLKFVKYSQGLQAYESKQYQRAICIFNELIESFPEHQYYTSRGTVYEDMGDDLKAKADFEEAVFLAPSNSLALFRLGMVYWRQKNVRKAIEYLRKSYEYIPTYDSLFGEGNYNSIEYVHKRVIAANLGMFLIQDNKHDEGCRYLDEVIDHCPDYAFPYYGKGLSLATRGKGDEATKYLKRAKELGYQQADVALAFLAKQQPSTNTVSADEESLNDECAKLVIQSSFNPFNISLDYAENQNLQFGDLTSVFKKEIQEFVDMFGDDMDFRRMQEIMGGYAYNMVDSYYKNAGFVPKAILDAILTQVYRATQSTTKGYLLRDKDLRAFKYRMYYNFTHR